MKKSWVTDKIYKLLTANTPIPCVDLVILRKSALGIETLLIRRKTGYEKGKYCLIGGRQRKGEVLQDAINRQASELGVGIKIIEPFEDGLPAFVNSSLGQDFTKQSVSIVYPVRVTKGKIKKTGEEFSDVKWFNINKLPKMGYDHKTEILRTLDVMGKLKAEVV